MNLANWPFGMKLAIKPSKSPLWNAHSCSKSQLFCMVQVLIILSTIQAQPYILIEKLLVVVKSAFLRNISVILQIWK